jgi:hypothetical protein
LKTMNGWAFCLLVFALTASAGDGRRALAQPHRIPVSFAVEAEGPGGLWAQSSNDLSKPQLEKLEQLIRAEVSKQEDVTVVEMNDPQTHLHISVVAAQLERRGNTNWIVASSVVTLAQEKGGDILGTHDVVAGPDLASVARTVAVQLATIKLRLITGIIK